MSVRLLVMLASSAELAQWQSAWPTSLEVGGSIPSLRLKINPDAMSGPRDAGKGASDVFQGSIPADIRPLVSELVGSWGVDDVTIGCSGNFTIERVLASLPKPPRLHGNDVSLYSCAVGSFLADRTFRLELRDEWKSEIGWLEPFLASPEDLTATVMLCSASPGPLTQIGTSKPYYARMRAAYREQWGALHEKTKEKLATARESIGLATFSTEDMVDLALTDRGPFVVFPPFDSGSYERQFRTLAEVFDWDEPAYELFDDARHELLLETLIARDHWLYFNNQRRPQLEPFLRGCVQATARSLPVYVYAEGGSTRSTRPNQHLEPVLAPHLTTEVAAAATQLTLAQLTVGQMASLRSQALNHNIAPGSFMLGLAVLLDGHVVGAFAFAFGKFEGDVYLLSDFALPGTPPKSSKLVLIAAVSKEARMLMERVSSKASKRLSTTAFSRHPVSMKYRGLFALSKRSPSDDPAFAYQLQYDSEMGRWTLAEGLAEWKKRYA